MSATSPPVAEAVHPLVREENLVRIYVWQWPVRIAHWVIFLSILVLSLTGYYMYDPFIISRGYSGYGMYSTSAISPTSGLFLMATMRFIHEVTAFVFIGAVLLRFYWFFKGNRWAHWRSFVPIERWWRHGIRRQVKYYLFLRRTPESEVGHNPLAAATYVVIYALMVVEIFTGMALLDYVNGLGHGALAFWFGWVGSIMSIQYVRETHFLIMFAFLAFIIHHVYSAVLIGIEERSGLVGGIFTGYKFFPAAFVAADPARRPHEEKIPAVPAGPSHMVSQENGNKKEPAGAAVSSSPAPTDPPGRAK